MQKLKLRTLFKVAQCALVKKRWTYLFEDATVEKNKIKIGPLKAESLTKELIYVWPPYSTELTLKGEADIFSKLIVLALCIAQHLLHLHVKSYGRIHPK